PLFLRSCDVPVPSEPYTRSLHDALPIWIQAQSMPMHSPICVEQDKPSAGWHTVFATEAKVGAFAVEAGYAPADLRAARLRRTTRSAEHTSELQSRSDLVCRLLLEKKKLK